MAVPKWKMSRSRTRRRRSHDGLTSPAITRCPQCKEPMRRHHLCLSCGSYNGRQVIKMEIDEES
ncbi:MAG: 50S ribosomal protein L32 [Armatimonadetes bacterium]|nr:50S ribosomal protein L32 [Armatimonadota bacterium]